MESHVSMIPDADLLERGEREGLMSKDRITSVDLPALLRAHDARVTELLEANNREVVRRRAAENVAANLRAMLLRIERKGVQPPPADDDQITALAGRIVDNLKALGRPAGKPDPVEQDRAEWNKEQRW